MRIIIFVCIILLSGCASTKTINKVDHEIETMSTVLPIVNLPALVKSTEINKVDIPEESSLAKASYQDIVENEIITAINEEKKKIIKISKHSLSKSATLQHKDDRSIPTVSFNFPEVMKVGEKAEVSISFQFDEKSLKSTKHFSAALIDTSNSFTISALSSPNQIVEANKVTSWNWQISPISEGKKQIWLQLTSRYMINGKEERWDYPLYSKEIEVKISLWQKIKMTISKYWKEITGIISSLGILTLIKEKFINKWLK